MILPTSYQGVPPSKYDFPSIAITGKMGAGKTTAAQHLADRYGYTVLHFAEPIKYIGNYLWGTKSRHNRGLLQSLGNKLREIDQDVLVEALNDTYNRCTTPVVVDDCRMPNEWWALKAAHFRMVEVQADPSERIERLMLNGKLQDKDQLNDITETALDGVDFVPDIVLQNWTGYQDVFLAGLDVVIEAEAKKLP